ncbi:DUF2093 domain-containing protein [Ferrovibrio sp.]|uniref:DUF2093 domain-containing protein n=1 Tax=Ferrovibrio sp. TaxID=1917215 RepID=UPI0035B45649
MDPHFSGRDNEARLHFRDGSYDIVVPGNYVICAVTGMRIPLDRLRYWDVPSQRAFVSAAVAVQALWGKSADSKASE